MTGIARGDGARRMLVAASPFPTHLMPLIALCWAWRAAGHELIVVGQPDILPVVRRAGLVGVPVGEAFAEFARTDRAPARPPSRGQHPPVPPWDKLGTAWRERVDTLLEPMLELARDWRPDIVLADPLEFTSLVVGGLLDVPVIQHLWGNDAWSVQVQAPAREQLAEYCHDRGLADGLPVADAVLDPLPAALPHPDWGRPIRCVPFNGPGIVPDWIAHPTRRRRVCLSVGTRQVALGGAPLLRVVAQACAAIPDVEVVLPLSLDERDGLDDLPSSVRLVEPCPLNLFVPTCDLVIHHGGSGTGMAAIVAGVPQLVLPWAAFFHTDVVEHGGVGLTLYDQEQDDPATLVASITRLLDEPSFADTARDVAAAAARMPSPAAVATDLADLAGRRAA